jgi:hypothetical protein
MAASSLLALPLELQEQVFQELGFPDNISLSMTCRHFWATTKPLTHKQLLLAERTEFAIGKDIYTCRDCLRLRPASKFADKMTKRKRGRLGSKNHKRFCVECGLKSGPRNTGYTRGSRIMIQGVCHVICIRCGEFGEGSDDSSGLSDCWTCGARRREIREFNEELRRREEKFQRGRLRAERIAARERRRERRRELFGSDNSMDSDDSSASLTSSEDQLEMIQAEADLYMNSPGPGSD